MTNTVFANMVYELSGIGQQSTALTQENYGQWQQQFTWDALYGQRYGQSFCNYFDVNDRRLYYSTDQQWCDRLIQSEYLGR